MRAANSKSKPRSLRFRGSWPHPTRTHALHYTLSAYYAKWVEAARRWRFLSDEAQCAEGLADAIGIDHAAVGAMSSARRADPSGWNLDEIYQKGDLGKMPKPSVWSINLWR
jgi:hypothetical protein